MQPIGAETLLRRAAQRAQAVGPVIVALPPAPHPRHDALAGLDVQRVGIADAQEGMNASLRGALAKVPQDAPAVMVVLSDLPDLTAEDLLGVRQSMTTHPNNLIWRGATQDGKPGHPVIFDRSLFDQLASLTGDVGAQAIVKRCTGQVHLHRLPKRRALMDLDTPEDWATWRAQQ